jgi:uncharacterized protein YndB with AHSA1/START domain
MANADDPLTHHVIVDAAAAVAFDTFTTRLGAWWPLSYSFSGSRMADAANEPRVGGVWFERNEQGETLPWGNVRAFEPGKRLVLAFAIGADRQPAQDDAASEVEVRFSEAGPGQTKVEVEHRDFAKYGDAAATMRAGMDSDQGWPLILAELKRWLRAKSAKA